MTDTTAVAQSPEHEPDLGRYIIHHIQDSHEWNLLGYHIHLPRFEPFHLFGVEIDLSITQHVVMMWFASFFLIVTFWLLFRKKSLVPRGFAAILESVVLFVRDEISIPNMGPKDGRRMTPLLSTMFLFILTCNLMGLIPLFATATGNISVTASLAIVTFFTTQIMGMVKNGPIGYWKSMVPHGIPLPLVFVVVPIEIFGLFTKPFALAMRLFANMIAGHTVIYALIGLIIAIGSFFVSPFAIGFAIFINLLEILVAFIQAYIFTMLSSLFIGMAMHPEH
ncbi:MAG: ATP synthase F0 subunit A [Calditrichaeota bacterium]|nr:F0F1 ATP synthase subunit A [Calditrichota bacterium]RQW03375.1 MAG: ATP synthase F0 subunit A [Calditrichota bacterium]